MADKDMVKAAKKTRTAKPIYAIISVADAAGNPVAVTKESITIHSVHKDADAVLEMLESNTLPEGTVYKRIPLS